MNRVERRKLQKEGKIIKKEPIINIKRSELEAIKKEAIREASEIAFILMLSIPVMVLHDHYSKIMKREVDGKNREERFADLCVDLYDSYDKGYVTLSDLQECLKEETGMEFEKYKGHGKRKRL